MSVCTPSWVRCATSGVPKKALARCLVITTSWGCGLNSARMAKSAGSTGGLLRLVAVTSAGRLSARIGLRQLCRGTRAAPVDELVEIDCEQCGIVPDEYLAPVCGIDFQDLGRHDVFPAMVLERIGH